RDRERAALMEFRGDRHGTPEAPHQGADMGKADALSRSVLRSRTAEQLENALMVLLIDTTPIVRYLENRKPKFGATAHCYLARNPSLEVFECVVDQIGQDL